MGGRTPAPLLAAHPPPSVTPAGLQTPYPPPAARLALETPGSMARAAAYAAAAALPGTLPRARAAVPAGFRGEAAGGADEGAIRAALLSEALAAGHLRPTAPPVSRGTASPPPVAAPVAAPGTAPAPRAVADARPPPSVHFANESPMANLPAGLPSRAAPPLARPPAPAAAAPPAATPRSPAMPPRPAATVGHTYPTYADPATGERAYDGEAEAAYVNVLPYATPAELTPTTSELRTLDMLGLEPSLLAELRSHAFSTADARVDSAGGAAVGGGCEGGGGGGGGRQSSLSSAGLADEALGGAFLSGLDTGLRERLRAQAREGRESGMMMSGRESGASLGSLAAESLRFSTDAAEHAALVEQMLREGGDAAAPEADAYPWMADEWGEHGPPSAAYTGPPGSEDAPACETCAALQAHFSEHDQWVSSLKQSAEEVLATHQRTRAALEGLLPGASSSEGGAETD